MLAIPLPLLTALLGAAIAIQLYRMDLGRRIGSILHSTLFALLSVSSLLVALRFGYGISDLIFVQRLTPLLVGPLLYLGFAAYALPSEALKRQMRLHISAAIVVLGIMLAMPRPIIALDWIISASYLIYLVFLILLWRRGPDALIYAHLDAAQTVSNWMLRGALLLGSILLLDTAIALDFAITGGRNASAMISVASIPIIVALLTFIFVLPTMVANAPDISTPPVRKPESDEDALEAKARALLKDTLLYLEPDLSVQRLARRLHVPVRALSSSINASQSMNVSQYVNRFRLDHAADLLRGTDDSVAKVMAQSGFLTRSNFYREFQRHFDMTPAAYRDAHQSK